MNQENASKTTNKTKEKESKLNRDASNSNSEPTNQTQVDMSSKSDPNLDKNRGIQRLISEAKRHKGAILPIALFLGIAAAPQAYSTYTEHKVSNEISKLPIGQWTPITNTKASFLIKETKVTYSSPLEVNVSTKLFIKLPNKTKGIPIQVDSTITHGLFDWDDLIIKHKINFEQSPEFSAIAKEIWKGKYKKAILVTSFVHKDNIETKFVIYPGSFGKIDTTSDFIGRVIQDLNGNMKQIVGNVSFSAFSSPSLLDGKVSSIDFKDVNFSASYLGSKNNFKSDIYAKKVSFSPAGSLVPESVGTNLHLKTSSINIKGKGQFNTEFNINNIESPNFKYKSIMINGGINLPQEKYVHIINTFDKISSNPKLLLSDLTDGEINVDFDLSPLDSTSYPDKLAIKVDLAKQPLMAPGGDITFSINGTLGKRSTQRFFLNENSLLRPALVVFKGISFDDQGSKLKINDIHVKDLLKKSQQKK